MVEQSYIVMPFIRFGNCISLSYLSKLGSTILAVMSVAILGGLIALGGHKAGEADQDRKIELHMKGPFVA